MIKPRAQDFIELLEHSKRGKLKIYVGSVAGVGKTCKMLQEAHELKNRGVDVVVGFVETHGRPDTDKLVDGLEIIPRSSYNYGEVAIEEMDLDTILSRKPEVVIVDELAHTNVPLCRNEKRYNDVIELILAGINVICAFNIQHLESLNDVVFSISGVRVHETIPDGFLAKADQIVNIDISVEDLQDRLISGKIYPRNKVDQALENFFKKENLAQLRELALREVAERIDISKGIDTADKEATSKSNDRLMVCFQPENISQKFLIRKASRMAGKLNTDWFVVYVETPDDSSSSIDSQKQRFLYKDIQLAEELGANFVHVKADNRVQAWLDFAKLERVKHMVLSNHRQSWWKRVTGQSIFDVLLLSNNYDIHIACTYED